MIDGSEEHKRQLAFELQNSHVFETSTIWVRNITENAKIKWTKLMSVDVLKEVSVS